MKMYKRIKKGFTLVELVVVIAVIAILAAVSVLSYTSITKKARQSKDQQIISEVNGAMQRSEVLKGKKPSTVHEALGDATEGGFKMQNIETSTKGYEYAYVMSANRFVVLENNKIVYPEEGFSNVSDTDIWVFADGANDLSSKFSNYLKAQNNKTISSKVTISTGFDAGENTLEDLEYKHSGETQDVVIRTNGGTFTVDAPNDTVRHFDTAEKVSIEAVKGNSYHENGSVIFTEISKGRIVLEKTSEVNHIHINKKTDDSFDTITIAKDETVEMPTLSRDDVNIAPTGTLVVALQEGTEESADKDYVWLTKQGIYEQVTISDTGSSSTSSTGVVWADDESVSETNQNAAQQIANNFISETVRPEWSAGDNNRDLANITNVEEIATAVAMEEYGEEWEDLSSEEQAALVDEQKAVVTDESKAIEEVADKESVQTGALLFAGGAGTKKEPWLIVDYDTMQHVTTVSKTLLRAKAVVAAIGTSHDYNYYAGFYGSYHASFSGYSTYDEYFETEWLPYKKYADDPTLLPTSSYYFKVKDGIKTIDCNQDGRNWKYVVLCGNFDGNGATFVNMDNNLFSNVSGAVGEKITIKNFTVRANICTEWGDTIASKVLNDIDLINITIHGYVQGSSNSALYLGYGPGDSTPWNCTFKNCYSDATYVSTIKTGGVYVGHPYALPSNYSIKIIDCEYTGQMYTTSGGNDCHAYTNYWGSTYYVQVSNDSGVSFTSHQGGEALSTSQQNKTGIIGVIPEKYNVFVTDAASNCDHATAFLTIGPNDNNEKGNYTNVYMSENNLRIENGKVYTDEIKYFDVTVNGNATDSTGLSSDGKVFNIVSGGYGTTYGSYFVVINQYDSNNNIISTTTFTLPLE